MQRTSWNMIEFRELTKKHLSQYTLEKLNSSLHSLIWKTNICKYHVEEYQKIIKETFHNELHPIVQAVGKVLNQAARTNEGNEFSLAYFKAEAHIIAFAQSLHSTADIFSHVLLYALQMESLIKDERRISLSKVHDLMRNDSIAPRVIKQIETYQNSNEFIYLNAFVNVTKHRSLVPSRYSIDLVEEIHDIQIKEFKYLAGTHLVKWAGEFTGGDFKRLLDMIQEIGITVNDHLGS